MIKCKNCGADLDINTLKCPYCGTINEEAVEHIEKMRKYQRDYESTKVNVLKKVKTFSSGYAYLITLIVLLVMNFVVIVISANTYDITDIINNNYYNKHKSEINEKLDTLLDNGDYDELDRYLYRLEYNGSIEDLDKYRELSILLDEYVSIKKNVMEYYDAIEFTYDDPLSRASSSIYNYYDYYNRYLEYGDSLYIDEIDTLTDELDTFMTTYLYFNADDLSNIKNGYSSVEINSLMHERLVMAHE